MPNINVPELVRNVITAHCDEGLLKHPIALCNDERSCGVMICFSAKRPGFFQATYFSHESLFEQDSQHMSLSEAVETVIHQGYTEDGGELLETVLNKSVTIH